MTATIARVALATLIPAAALMLSACGDSISGTYGETKGVNMTFNSKGKVELDVLGPIQEGTYVVEDGKVKVTAAGQTMVLRIDDKGCLDSGAMMGKLCKQ